MMYDRGRQILPLHPHPDSEERIAWRDFNPRGLIVLVSFAIVVVLIALPFLH